MRCLILTLYPEMFPGVLGHSLTGTALRDGLWSLDTIDIRDFATDKHRTVDDTPYGGGAGMVMKADVVGAAIETAYERLPDAQLIYMTPRGIPLTQTLVKQVATTGESSDIIFLCGRFEGIDQRVLDVYQPLEISIGDYILCGGELAAQVMIEAMLRYVPGVLGNVATTSEESFTLGQEKAGLLEYPHYSKPPLWKGRAVPDVLTSGHHGKIAAWRKAQAEQITQERRQDLWNAYCQYGNADDGDDDGKHN